MCLYPKLIKNPKYKPNKKNGGIVQVPRDPRILAIPIGCGECIECMQKKKREWAVRLKEEIKNNNNATFVTLTFSNESITELYNDKRINNLTGYNLDNAAATLATRLFLERWRKKNKKSIKHWLVTELGHNGTENIHMHGLIWSKDTQAISNTWQYGWTYMGQYVNEKTINYISKYISKQDEKHKGYKPKILTSAGIGKTYTESVNALYNKYNTEKTNETYRDTTGTKTALPIYYRNKIYTEEEREKLWIEKLDKDERYILGRKVTTNTEQGKEIYKKLLQSAQQKNLRLGYGKGHTKWIMATYEAERRNLLQEKRKGVVQGVPIEAPEPLHSGHVGRDATLPTTQSQASTEETNIQGLLAYIKTNK